MRAYMSDRTARPAPTYNAWTGQMVEQTDRAEMLDVEAEREARAILAETEPQYSPLVPWDAGWRMSGNETPEQAAGRALADALRSFVGEPCHCAQGLHWSPGRGYFHCAGVTPEA